jgi:hypothetical protein
MADAPAALCREGNVRGHGKDQLSAYAVAANKRLKLLGDGLDQLGTGVRAHADKGRPTVPQNGSRTEVPGDLGTVSLDFMAAEPSDPAQIKPEPTNPSRLRCNLSYTKTSVLRRGTESSQTLRWRKTDSKLAVPARTEGLREGTSGP